MLPKGVYYSFSLFFISTLLEIVPNGKGMKVISIAANQLNDLMPNIKDIDFMMQ